MIVMQSWLGNDNIVVMWGWWLGSIGPMKLVWWWKLYDNQETKAKWWFGGGAQWEWFSVDDCAMIKLLQLGDGLVADNGDGGLAVMIE